MKYLRKFNESKISEQDIERREKYTNEILSNYGWERIDPPSNDNWDIELRYNLKDNIVIDVLSWGKELNYYLRDRNENFHYVGCYSDDYQSELYSVYSSPYRDLSRYDRMMKICKYHIPYFEKRPSESLIEDIKECFFEVGDEIGIEPHTEWGYRNSNGEYGFFPAFRFSDKLCLCIIYEHYRDDKVDFESVKSEFDECKLRLEMYDINPREVEIVNESYRVVIIINF